MTKPATSFPPRRRRLRRWALAVGLGFPLLLAGLFGVALTPPGRAWLARYASARVSAASGHTVQLRGLKGFLPWAIGLDSVTVSDDAGQWLAATDVRAVLRLRPLLQGAVRLDSLSIAGLDLARLPNSAGSNGGDASELPNVSLGQLTISKLTLGPAVAGQDARLRVDGWLQQAPEGIQGELAVKALDPPGEGRLTFSLATGKQPRQMDVALDWREQKPFLSGLAGLPEMTPFALTASCRGPLSALSVQVEIRRGDEAAMTLSGSVSYTGDEKSLQLEGRIRPYAWPLPESLPCSLPAVLNWGVGGVRRGESCEIRNAWIQSEFGELALSGQYDLGSGAGEVQAKADTADLAAWGLGTPEPLRGPLTVELQAARDTQEGVSLHLSATTPGVSCASWTVDAVELSTSWATRRLQRPHWPDMPEGRLRCEGRIGRLTGPAGALPVAVEELQWAGEGNVEAGVLHVATLQAHLPWVEVFGSLDWAPREERLAADLTWRFEDLAPLSGLAAATLGGRLTAHTQTTLTTDAWQGTVKAEADWDPREWLELPRGILGAPTIHLETEADRREDGLVTIGRLQLTAGQASLGLRGTADPAGKRAQLEFQAHCADLETLQDFWPQAPSGQWTGSGELALAAEALTADVDWRAADLGLGTLQEMAAGGRWHLEWPHPFATGPLRLTLKAEGMIGGLPQPSPVPQVSYAGRFTWAAPDHLEVASLSVTADALRIEAEGTVQPQSQELNLTVGLDMPDVGAWAAQLGVPVAGKLAGAGTARGQIAALEWTARLQADELRVKDESLKQTSLNLTGARTEFWGGTAELASTVRDLPLQLTATWRLENERLRFSEMALAGPDVAVRGQVDLDLALRLTAGRLSGDVASIKPFAQAVGQELAGAVALDLALNVEGTRQDAELKLDLTSLHTPWFAARTVGARMHAKDVLGDLRGRIDVTAADVGSNGLTVDTATLSVDGSAQAFVLSTVMEGRLADRPFDLAVSAQAHSQELFEVDMIDAKLGGLALSLAEPMRVERKGDRLELAPTRLRVGTGAVIARGYYAADSLRAELQFDAFPVAPLIAAPHLDLQGAVTGNLTLVEDGNGPRIDAVVSLEGFQVNRLLGQEILAGNGRAQLHFSQGTGSGNLQFAGTRGENVQASAQVPMDLSLRPFAWGLAEGGTLQGRLSVDADVGRALRPLMPIGNEFEGRLSGDVAIDGAVAAPDIRGRLALSGGMYANHFTGTVVRGLEAQLDGNGRELRLTDLRAGDGHGGTLRGTGRWSPQDDQESMELDGAVADFLVYNRPGLTVTAGGDVRLSGTPGNLLLGGMLTVSPVEAQVMGRSGGFVELDVTETRNGQPIDLPGPARPVVARAQRQPGSLRLDLTVHSPSRVFVRGRGLDTEWRGDVKVSGPAEEPLLSGELSIVRGTYVLAGKRLRIVEGSLRFDGSRPVRPLIRLVAERNAGDTLVRVVLTGLLEAPKLDLQSEPPMPKDEILSRLLFRRGTGQISAYQALTLAQAADALARGGDAFDINAQIRRYTGLDQIDVVAAEEAGGTSRVEVGKYMTDRIYLSYDHGLGQEETSRVRVEVEVTPRLSVESGVGSTGGGGLGVNWKQDY